MNSELFGEKVEFPQVAAEIKKMIDADQEMRERWEDDDFSDEDLDSIHTDRMKEIVSEIGWPTIPKVGLAGAESAWLLVQHADHDVDFQIYCLDLMKSAPKDEVGTVNIAYLEDRVRVNQGRGQLYGTQFTQENNQHIPRTIEDADNVDARRAEIGMGPLQEQIDHMYQKYPFKTEKA